MRHFLKLTSAVRVYLDRSPTGPIPVEVSQLKVLKVLKLNGNQLNGKHSTQADCMMFMEM